MSGLRYLYLFSYLFVVISLVLIGAFVSHYIENNIVFSSSRDSLQARYENFYNSVWLNERSRILQLPCRTEDCTELNKTEKLIADNFVFNKNIRYAIIARDGTILSGANKDYLSSSKLSKEKIASIISKTLEGNIDQFKDEIIADDGTSKSVYRMFFPLTISEGGKGLAVLDLSYDISSFWNNPIRFQVFFTGVIVGFFSLFFGFLYIVSLRIESKVTKQYEGNIELIKQKLDAESENREKSKFLANISHELRTPLNAIIGFSEIIKDEVMGPLNNQTYMDYVKDIHLSGVHLLSLINDILDYSKLEAGKLQVDIQDTDVTKILKNSLRLVSQRSMDAGINLESQIPESHFVLKTDQKRLKQIVLNLLSNAVKFTPQGGSVTLSAWHMIADNKLYIEVKDTGVGIAPKDISKVMQQFGQVQNDLSRKYEGTGLGLPLSKKLVELLGGVLEIESEVGKGTVVTIKLPYIESDIMKEASKTVNSENN